MLNANLVQECNTLTSKLTLSHKYFRLLVKHSHHVNSLTILILFRIAVGLETIPRDLRYRAHMHTLSHTYSHNMGNLKICMSLDLGGKLEYSDGTDHRWREPAKSTHTDQKVGFKPMLPTMPPCYSSL